MSEPVEEQIPAVLPPQRIRPVSLLNLRLGQPKGPMWPLLRYDQRRAFETGTKISHMVTCIGHVLYSGDSLYSNFPSRVYMVDCL